MEVDERDYALPRNFAKDGKLHNFLRVVVYMSPLVISVVFYVLYRDLWAKSEDYNDAKNQGSDTDYNYYDSCNNIVMDYNI